MCRDPDDWQVSWCAETHIRIQSHAAILANDVQWLFSEPPVAERPRLFYPDRAQATDWGEISCDDT